MYPWLGECPWLADSSNHQIGALGQTGSSQAHLDNQKVGEGSLFLFFSRFKPINQNRQNDVVLDIEWENIKKGLYFIYGWLKVKKVINQYKDINNPILEKRHPHATEAYFLQNKNNTIYIACELLFEGSKIPGFGYFPQLNRHLLLTAPEQKLKWIPSRWKLPNCFLDSCLSVMKDKEKYPCNDSLDSSLVDIPGRWQEAVFEGNGDIDRWYCDLLNKCGIS